MLLSIRGETPGDEDAIDEVVASAFGTMDEANLVRMIRASLPGFDRRFSITAHDGEDMVGHALFLPARVRFLGRTVAALSLGPIAVRAGLQKKGIGGQLIRFGGSGTTACCFHGYR